MNQHVDIERQRELKELRLYSVPELARLWDVSNRTLYRYIHSGKLKATKVGKRWRITRKEIDRFLGDRQ